MFKLKIYQYLFVFLSLSLFFMLSAAESVIHHPNFQEPLNTRWQWALQEAASQGDVWIGYNIRRMMYEDSHIGSFHHPPRDEDIPLQELLYGVEMQPEQSRLSGEEQLKEAAEKALAKIHNQDYPREKISKQVAILFRLNPASGSGSPIQDIKISNLNLAVDLKSLPLYWLGEAENAQSLILLQEIFEKENDKEVKEDMITAISIHDSPVEVFSFLKSVVNGDEEENIRESAVFWMGQQASKEALEFLIHTAENDRSRNIREEAVFAISQIEIPQTTGALVDLARNSRDQEIQKEAVFWLGQKASEQAESALTDFAYSHDDVEIQKSAVFALSQLSDNSGVPKLIEIAKNHPHPRIRKEAIFWLSQSDDPRAVDTLVDILQQQ